MSQRYTIAEHGPRIDGFLKKLLPLLGVNASYEMAENETLHPEFENPDIRVKFSGNDIDQLLANKTEMMLALVVILLLFGAKRIPEIAGSFGKGIKEFKKNMNDVQREVSEPSRNEALPPSSASAREESAPAAEPKRLI